MPGKVLLNFVRIHHAMLWRDVLQQQPKLRDVPLAVAKRINGAALDVLPLHHERHIESAVCRDDTQVLIEDQERLADGIDDRLSKRVRTIRVDAWLIAG